MQRNRAKTMPVSYAVTQKVLSKFKEPFGVLIRGSFVETARKLKELIDTERPDLVVS